jgi:hypothetical protein
MPVATREVDTRPAVPEAKEFVRYERVTQGYEATAVGKGHGDAVVAALHGGTALMPLGDWVRAHETAEQAGMMVDPIPTNVEVVGIRKDGMRYVIALSRNGGLADLPIGEYGSLYAVTPPADGEMKKAVRDVQEDLRAAVVGTRRPSRYVVGLLEDGGTLSGVARIFYGKAGRWRDIYAANKGRIKDPNVIAGGLTLVIPE